MSNLFEFVWLARQWADANKRNGIGILTTNHNMNMAKNGQIRTSPDILATSIQFTRMSLRTFVEISFQLE